MKTDPIAKILRLITIPLLVAIALAGSYFHALDSYELQTLDLRFRLRGTQPVTDKIVIVEIGDDTIEKLGHFPFDRSYHALLIKALSEAGAKAIVFDLFFSERHKDDAEFEKAVEDAGNVYFPLVFDLNGIGAAGLPAAKSEMVKNIEGLIRGAKGMGHINTIPDIDGKYRRAPAYVRYGDLMYPYLGLKVACDYLGISQDDVSIVPGRYCDLGRGLRLPLDENSMMMVNFSGPWGSAYKHYSYVDILQSYLAKITGKTPNVDPALLKDKICLVGLTAVGTVDLHPNPFDALYPAVGMHADTFNSVVERSFVRRASRAANIVILIVLMLLVSVLVLNTKPLRASFILFSVVSVYALICILIFSFCGIWLDVFYPIVVVVLLHLLLTFSKYVREWKGRLLMENELGIAKKIQESFLPASTPAIKSGDIAAAMFTARQVGGDLYDFVAFGDPAEKGQSGRFGVMIGDVSGKGVPAALFMAMVVGAFRSFATPVSRPEEVLSNLNVKLVKESASNLFVTVFYAIFDIKKNVLEYANGGHLPVLYMPREGVARFLDTKDGAPLGLVEGPYAPAQVYFHAGDIFIFYTDGITEAMNGRSDMYGKERLQAVVEKNRSSDAKRLLEIIEKDVRKFEPKALQHDDMTIIIVKIG